MQDWECIKWKGWFMKIFDAKVENGKVIADGAPVENCPILGEGGDSEGFLIMAEGEIVYLPKRSPDLKNTLQILSNLISILASEIYQSNGGGNITNPTFTADLAQLKNSVEELKGALK